MTSNTASYKKRLYDTVENLPPIYQAAFKKALMPHKFNLEIYVPKNLLNKKEISDKNYLRNKLVQFNDNFKEEKAILTQLKKETEQFSRQYKLVTQSNTFDEADKSNNNKVTQVPPINNKNSSYEDEILEIYKLKGYNERDIKLNENVFNPSLLLELDSNYDLVCELENEKNIKDDQMFMENIEKYLKVKLRNQRDAFSFQRQQTLRTEPTRVIYPNNQNLSLEEIELPPISLKELKRENTKLIKDIKLTNKSIDEVHAIQGLVAGDNNNDKIKGYMKTRKKKKKDKIKVDGIFLSSKGMLRSAKNRIIPNKVNEKNKKEKSKIKITKSTDIPQPHIHQISEKQKEVNYEKKKTESLYNLYNNITKNSFAQERKNAKNYIEQFTRRKLEPLK